MSDKLQFVADPALTFPFDSAFLNLIDKLKLAGHFRIIQHLKIQAHIGVEAGPADIK